MTKPSTLGNDTEEFDWFLKGKLPLHISTPPSQKDVDSPGSHLSSSHPSSERLDHTSTNAFHSNLVKEQQKKLNSKSDNEEIGHVLSRSVSLPAATNQSPIPTKKKSGFLRNIFGKSKKETTTSTPVNSPSISHSPSPKPQSHIHNNESATSDRLARTRSLSASSQSTLDPRLDEFFKFYKSNGLEKIHSKDSRSDFRHNSIFDTTSPQESSQATPVFQNHVSSKGSKLDQLGRPIPSHPSISPLPSALVKNHHHDESVKKQLQHTVSQQTAQQQTASSKLGFLRRNHSVVESSSGASSIKSIPIAPIVNKPAPAAQAVGVEDKFQELIIPGLENLPPLKRVSFDFPVFYNDPPQQIPSRNPRKGEVEIKADGTIVIHKLTAEERRKILASAQGGIVVGGSGPLKILTKEQREAIEKAQVDNSTGIDATKRKPKVSIDLNSVSNASSAAPATSTTGGTVKTTSNAVNPDSDTDSDSGSDSDHDSEMSNSGIKHTLQAAASAAAASSRGREAPNELRRTVTNHEEEVIVNNEATKINIDKPMARHNKSYTSMSNASLHSNEEFEELVNKRELSVPLDVLYSRCCHLREILPIPATVKQISPGSTDAIPLLQLRNPKPSLVEVLTFSDFISVAPILCISLDGVQLSSEMFRIILASLAHKKELEKLTLRNTPIDELGWSLLCWFLTKNKNVSRLDLTQVPSLTTNVQKPSKSSASSTIVRMQCDKNSRSEVNWNLFNAALISRNGIDELVLNGARIPEDQFKNLMEMGIRLNTTKLGLAYNNLTTKHVELLAHNLNLETLSGLDLGYNDLDGKLHHFVEMAHKTDFTSTLKYISLNSTNLSNKDDDIKHFIAGFAKLQDLKYLDFSNNKKLFPDLINILTPNLPLFPKLARIHFDYNDLNQSFLVAFAELIPFCPSLSFVSLLGSKINLVSGTALVSAMGKSHSLVTLDIDMEESFPHELEQQMALYSVKNMQSHVYNRIDEGGPERKEDLKSLQDELSHLLREKENSEPDIFKSFVNRAINVRKSIHETIEELFKLRLQGKLSVEGKETLIRFCFIDSSIENGLKLLKQKTRHHDLDKVLNLDFSDENAVLDGQKAQLNSRKSATNIIESYVNSKGHGELMPFSTGASHGLDDEHEGEPQILADSEEEVHDQTSDTSGSLVNDPESYSTNAFTDSARSVDDSKLKEEGSLLKIGSFIKKSDLANTLSEDHIKTLTSMSGDDIRKVMLKTNNVDNIVSVLDEMKAKGIQLGDIYQKHDDSTHSSNGRASFDLGKPPSIVSGSSSGESDKVYLETDRNTNANVINGNKKVFDIKHKGTMSDTDSESSDDENGATSGEEGIGHAFDQILDEIVRVRTNT